MKSFKFVMKNKILPLTLFIQEIVFYIFIMAGFIALFTSAAGNELSTFEFSISYMLNFQESVSNGMIPLYFVFIAVIFSIIYFIFITGIFHGLASSRKMKFSELVYEGLGSFFKFMLIFIVFIIFTGIFTVIISKIFSKLSENTFNTKLPLIYLMIKFILMGFVACIFSYFQSKSRFKYLKEGRLSFFNKLKFKEFLSFFGYQILSLISLALGVWVTYFLLLSEGMFLGILGVIIFQILFFFRVVFKLSAYKVTE